MRVFLISALATVLVGCATQGSTSAHDQFSVRYPTEVSFPLVIIAQEVSTESRILEDTLLSAGYATLWIPTRAVDSEVKEILDSAFEESKLRLGWNSNLYWIGKDSGANLAARLAPQFDSTTGIALLSTNIDAQNTPRLHNPGFRMYVATGSRGGMAIDLEKKFGATVELDWAGLGPWTLVRYENWNPDFVDSSGVSHLRTVYTNVVLWLLVAEDQGGFGRGDKIHPPKSCPWPCKFDDGDPWLKASLRRRQVNASFMHRLIDRSGFPLISSSGVVASRNAWLLVQHSDDDPDFQQKVADLLNQAFLRNDAYGPDVAFLTDRAMVGKATQAHRKPTVLFGTQTSVDKQGCVKQWPIDDRRHVNERRKKFGLIPLEDDVRDRNLKAGKPECNRKLKRG